MHLSTLPTLQVVLLGDASDELHAPGLRMRSSLTNTLAAHIRKVSSPVAEHRKGGAAHNLAAAQGLEQGLRSSSRNKLPPCIFKCRRGATSILTGQRCSGAHLLEQSATCLAMQLVNVCLLQAQQLAQPLQLRGILICTGNPVTLSTWLRACQEVVDRGVRGTLAVDEA